MSSGRLRVFGYLIAASIGLLGSGLEPAWAETLLESGLENYNYKRYWTARDHFQKAVDKNPSDQKAYYYLGMSLEALKDRENAKAAYRACYSLNPFSDMGQQARQALLNVSEKIESNAHRAPDTPETVAKSGILIQRQAIELQERKLREARGHASFRMQQGNHYSGRGRRNPVSNYTGYDPRMMGNFEDQNAGYDYLLNRNPRDEVSNRQFLQNSHMLYDSANEAAKMRGHGARTAVGIGEFSNGLIERLGRKKTSEDGSALRALGTNLYVQYYRSAEDEDDMPPPPDQPLELRARQMKLQHSYFAPPPYVDPSQRMRSPQKGQPARATQRRSPANRTYQHEPNPAQNNFYDNDSYANQYDGNSSGSVQNYDHD